MKHLENEIMEYLANEMDVETRSVFESKMNSNPELKAEVLAIQSTKAELQQWSDDVIEVPSYDLTKNDNNKNAELKSRETPRLVSLPSWIRYAAAAAVLLGIFWMSGLQINRVGNSLALSFGEPEMLTNIDQKMKSQVASAVEDYMQTYDTQFTAYQNQVDQSLKNISVSLDHFNDRYSNENNKFRNRLISESSSQYAKLEQMIRGIENEQRQEIEGSLASLVQYWDDQRSTDLFKIENAFNEVAAAINNQQERTNAIFSSLSEPVAVTTNY